MSDVTDSPDPPAAAGMAKAYDPASVEQRIYARWEADGHFRPSGDPSATPFTIIMPPPNLTGELHVGSAVGITVEDLLIRWHRMKGDDTLWLPGVDHAAISVNAIVERQLAAEGISRHDLGREAFLERVWSFVNQSRDYISRQFRRLGASADWEREVFTMDPGPQRAVRATFKRLYDDGLIYRGERIINWCTDCATSISDLEVEHEEEATSFWHIRYPLLDAEGQPNGEHLIIATTRPETIPADVAVAVNPDDPRYQPWIGHRVQVPTTDRTVPVIADAAVDIESGSGVLKVTPGHDPVDFEIGRRHDLPILTVIGLDGNMTETAGRYAGLDRFVARDRLVADLEAEGRIERIEPYRHPVAHCERSGTIVEPLVSEQWFVRMEPLAAPAIAAVVEGRLHFVPRRFERTYLQWLENIRDWCISRQIWWGHRIPVWYCDACDERTVAIDDPSACQACGAGDLRQDEDTLDTWFSSGLWPHSTLGWPEQTADLQRYYPSQVMETGYDIIFFWVARMVMLSIYNMDGVPPFETVYLHGLVRDAEGRKMSKSRGNVVDPLEACAEYGTDALRFALATSAGPGNDMRLTNERLEAGRNFANKLWNAARFVLGELGDDPVAPPSTTASLTLEDRWILSRLHRLTATVDDLLGQLLIGEAGRQIHDFLWAELFDWYLEAAKVRLRSGDQTPLPVLVHALDQGLRLLHPYMPYVTEEIWQQLRPHREAEPAPALIVAAYPQPQPAWDDPAAERAFAVVQDTVRAIRQVRADKRVDAGRWVEAYAVDRRDPADGGATGPLRDRAAVIEALARVRPLHVIDERSQAPADQVVGQVLNHAEVVLPLGGLVDLDQERARVGREIDEAQERLARIEAKLTNPNFRAKAPAAVVAKETEREREVRDQIEALMARRTSLD